MKTRILLLLSVLFFSLTHAAAHDFEAVNSDGKTIYYKVLTDNTCAVTYKGTSYSSEDEYSGTIVVPSKVVSPVDGKERTVTNLGSYAFNYSSVERLILPEGLTAIDGMLSGTSKLKYIYIPSTLTTITGGYLTGDLTSLEEVEWNAKQYANTTDKPVFRNTTTYFNHIGVRKITFGPDVAVIPAYMCRNIGSLNTVVLSANVKVVGNYAFDGCTGLFEVYNLSSIPLEKGSMDYGSVAQYAKVIHTSTDEPSICIYTPDWYLTLIDGELGVFRYVGSATTVVMPQSFTVNGKEYKEYGIMGDSFYGGPASEKVTSLTLPDNLLFLNGGALSASRIKSITIPKTLKKIGSGVFPSTIETVNWNATETHYINLEDMWSAPGAILPSNLKTLNMGEGIKVIPASFMRGNTSLYTFTIPETVEEIEAYAFEGCLALTGELKLPEGLKTLGRQAFYGCKNLYGELTFPAGLKVILEKTFYNCTSLSGTLTIPESIDSIGSEVFYNTGFTKVQFNAANYKTNTARYYGSPFKGMQKINTFAFGENVKNIPAYICQNLKLSQIALPEKVETIGAYAFDNCGASMGSTLVLPETLKSIGEKALLVDGVTLIIYKARKAQLSGGRRSEFYSGTFSANIHLANTVDSIPDALFKDSHNIDSVYYDIPDYTYDNRPLDKVSEKVTKIGIGPSVRTIPDKFFKRMSNVARVNIPATVENMGCDAFNSKTTITAEKNYGQTITVDAASVDTWDDVYLFAETLDGDIEIAGSVTSFDGCPCVPLLGEFPGIKLTAPYSITLPISYCVGVQIKVSNGTDCTKGTLIPSGIDNATCKLLAQTGTEIAIMIKSGDDATVPEPADKRIILDENGYSETFKNKMGDFTEFDVYKPFGEQVWNIGSNNIFAQFRYNYFCEAWLVSPEFDCSNVEYLTLQFEHSLAHTNGITDIKEYIGMKITTDGESWTDLPITTYPALGASNSYIMCRISLKEYISDKTRFAFTYKTDNTHNPNWMIKNLKVITTETYIPDAGFGYMNVPVDDAELLPNLFYDVDNDGMMEYVYFEYKSGDYYDKDDPGNTVFSIYSYQGALKDNFFIPGKYSITAIEDIDRNGVADFIIAYSGKSEWEDEEGQVYILPYDTKTLRPLSDAIYNNYNVLFDANGDGRTDYYVDIANNSTAADYIYLQQPDGTFVRTDIVEITDEETILDEAFAQSGANIVLPPPVHFGGASLAKAPRPPHRDDMQRASQLPTPMYGNKAPLTVDINRDGMPDMLNLYAENSFISLGDGKYYYGSLFGEVTVGDYNSDGIQDLIIFDPSSKTVYLYLYDGNNVFSKQVLMQNMNITRVASVDIDNDGDLDIVLAFDWTEKSQYAMLVTYQNNDGKFKKKEHAFGLNRKIHFFDIADVDGDGVYEMVCGEGGGSDEANHPAAKYFLAECKADFKINEEEQFFVYSNLNSTGTWVDDVPNFVMGDFDNDGNTEYWVVDNEYSYCGRFRRETANAAPEKMAAPTCLLDAESGMLKVEWQPATDSETSTCDLTYSVRVGSAPGKSDIMNGLAGATGKRLRPGIGNARTDLFSIFDTRNWRRGTYYIAVQAIDKEGLAGEWSDELVFNHDQLYASFEMDHSRLFVTETLTLKLSNGYDPDLTYEWSLGENAKIVDTDDNGTWRVVFSRLEELDIELRVSDAEGVYATSQPHRLTVLPVKFIRDQEYSQENHNTYTFTSSGTYFDFDMDGSVDVLGWVYDHGTQTKGLHLNGGNNRFSKAAYSFNLDLDPKATLMTDFNMDGFADFYSTSDKGDMFTNTGDDYDYIYEKNGVKSFFVENYFITDLDMDGYNDMISKSGDIYFNQGDNINFTQYKLNTYSGTRCFADYDKDGLLDVITLEGSGYVSQILLYKNNGDGTFAKAEHIMNGDGGLMAVIDFDNDGNVDIIGTDGTIHWGNGDGTFTDIDYGPDFKGSDYTFYDLDNNGYIDIILYEEIYFQQEGRNFIRMNKSEDGGKYPCNNTKLVDLNGDGTPDYGEYIMSTTIGNTAPETPQNVKAVQDGGFVLLSWDDAFDAETPFKGMRYNVSVKKSGATGEGSYIISPLNNEDDMAAASPDIYYYTNNTLRIPASRFTVGESYDIKVQAIDGWYAHSPFSEKFTITVESEVSISAPTEACTGVAVTVTYAGTEQGTPQWRCDDAVINVYDNSADFTWSTPGVKTIECTLNGITSTRAITIIEGPDLEFTLPSKVLSSAYVYFTLPDAFADRRNSISVRTTLSETPQPVASIVNVMGAWMALPEINADRREIKIERRGQTLDARMTAAVPDGDYWIEFVCNTTSCGEISYRQYFTVDGDNVTPEISIVTIDDATGKNVINWQRPANLPNSDLYTTMVIYREEGSTDNFVRLGEASISEGRFVDSASDPSMRKYRYRIALKTNYGGISTPSEVHSSVHVMLNRGLTPGSVNIVWTPYEGGIIEQYTILRGTSPDNMQTLTTASGYEQSYTDMASPSGDVYYALSYTNTYDNSWIALAPRKTPIGQQKAAKVNSGRSNAVNANASNSVTTAKSLEIRHLESEPVINGGQTALHLYCEILPGSATYKVVNWQVTAGQNLVQVSSSGLVSYIGGSASGTATIKATTVDGSNISKTINIRVDGFEAEKEVASVMLSATTTTLTPDMMTTYVAATIAPEDATDKSLTWSVVSGNSIASVNQEGTVTALGNNGMAIVRATAVNGVYGEITITASGFESEGVDVTSVTLSASQTALTPDRMTTNVMATLLPEDATDKTLTWSVASGSDIVSVDQSGLVTSLKKNGTASIRATANNGVYGEITITASGFNTATESVNESDLTIYPVPADDVLFIDTDCNIESIRIVSADGRMVYLSTEKVTAINVSNLPNGVYNLLVTTDTGKLMSKKVVIK